MSVYRVSSLSLWVSVRSMSDSARAGIQVLSSPTTRYYSPLWGPLALLPQRISIQSDKNKTISRKMEPHFSQSLLAGIKGYLGGSQGHE